MKSKASKYFIFGIVCLIFGLITDSTNFIPAIYKYAAGIFFIGAAIYLWMKESRKKE